MSISFNEVPNDLRIPFVTAEIDNSRSSNAPGLISYRAFMICQMTSNGTADNNSIHQVFNPDEVGVLCGRDSVGYEMALGWYENNDGTELWIGCVDDGAGSAASGSVQVTGAPTGNGTCHLYLGGRYVPVAITAGTAAAAAALIEAEIDAYRATEGLPSTPSVSTDTVTIDFNHDGELGNDYDIRVNYQTGQELPEGMTVDITAMSGGATNPSLTSLIAAMGDQWFHVIVHPYTDATSLSAIEAELADRFGPMRMIDGLAITSATGSVSTLNTLGNTRNSQHNCIVAQPGANPITSPWQHAARVGAGVAKYGAIDPARPFQTLQVKGSLPPVTPFTDQERNTMLHNGIATTKEAAGGVVRMDRIITTYKTNAAGGLDESYLDSNTMLTLLYLRWSFRNLILNKYPRHKLASNGVRVGAGQAVMTPILGQSEAINWFRNMENLGLVEGFDDFKANLVVKRNASNKNRLDFLLPPDLMNQLMVTAAKIQFRL